MEKRKASLVAEMVKTTTKKKPTTMPADAGDPGSISVSRRSPGGGNGNPLQYSCLENAHGQRSLAGYGPRGRKESDMTEQLNSNNNN